MEKRVLFLLVAAVSQNSFAMKVPSTSDLREACDLGRTEDAIYFLRQGQDPNSYDGVWKHTPLHLAVWHSNRHMIVQRKNDAIIIVELLKYGANPNARDHRQETPLHYAIGDPEITALLLKYGANPNVYDETRRTPLHLAVGGDIKEVRLLLEKLSTDAINVRDIDGLTPLDRAVNARRKEIKALFQGEIDFRLVLSERALEQPIKGREDIALPPELIDIILEFAFPGKAERRAELRKYIAEKTASTMRKEKL